MMNKPKGAGTPLEWHQDVGEGWGIDSLPTLTTWLSLDDATTASGAMQIVRGSHRRGVLNAGHFADEATMAAYGLGNALCNLFGRFVVLGVACALDTLASQAWGAHEPRKAGLYALRATLILLVLVCAPLTAVWWFASPILVALGQPPAVADQTSLFARLCIPGLYASALSTAGSKLFLALGKSRPVMLTSLLAEAAILTLLLLLIVHPYRLGLTGAAIATLASNRTQCDGQQYMPA